MSRTFWKEAVIRLFYPRVCPLCERVIHKDGMFCCPDCQKKLPYITGPTCMKCGKPIPSETQEYCFDCRQWERAFDRGFSVFTYKKVQRPLLAMKEKDRREYADFFALELVRRHGKKLLALEPQVLMPVPIHWSRRLERGYNQTELVAKRVGRYLNLPVDTHTLIRSSHTNRQKNLNARQRAKNLENAFHIGRNAVRWERVILLDDIYTTGATAHACATALKKFGVKNVWIVTLACGENAAN